MIENIIKFIDILRSMNVRISIAESIEAIQLIDIIGIQDKEDFKTTLRSILIKNYEDIEKFDKLFDIFFIYKEEEQKIEFNEKDFENLFAQLQSCFDDNYNDIGEEKTLSQEINNNINEQNIKNDLREKIEMFQMGGNEELKKEAKNIANNMNYNKQSIDQDIERELYKQGYQSCKSASQNKQNEEFIEEKYNKLKEYIKEEIEKNEVRKNGTDAIKEIMKEDYEDIYEKDFIELSKKDIEIIKKILNKIIKKLNNIYIRKKIKSKKGNIDIKTTIRKIIKNGIIKDIYYKKNKKDKNNLIILCDISGSMINYVKFILQIVVGIEEVFDDVKVCVFMEKLKDITEELQNSEDILTTIEDIYKNSNLGFGTDYGNALFWFNNKKYFNKKTRIIIIGDAKNNGDEIGDNYLYEIKRKSKNIYWLNPDKENEWDENFNNYKIYCDKVFECNNLKQLEQIMNKIV